jgi:hypothetical protein
VKVGDLVWDLRLKHIGIVTDTYVQPQLNKLYVKIFAAGRETGWILESEVEPVQDERDVVEWEHQSRRHNESVRGR